MGNADMRQQIAIVTGASRGIGQATALRLAQDFVGVVIVARSAEAIHQTKMQIEECGTAALDLTIDLRQPDAGKDIVAQALERFGRIDALVNVAGAVPQADLFAMTDSEWNDGLALKFHGARRLTLAAWDALRRSRGSVVFTSGASALAPKASLAAVGTINAAICALAKAFSERGIEEGVQVNSVLPGPVMTSRRRTMLTRYAEAKGIGLEEAIPRFVAEAHITRYGEPTEIAELIAFLVSPCARWLTGSAVRMDGGEAKAI
jgi:3-oxoacyl-[acyl-carrier protein] reductase